MTGNKIMKIYLQEGDYMIRLTLFTSARDECVNTGLYDKKNTTPHYIGNVVPQC